MKCFDCSIGSLLGPRALLLLMACLLSQSQVRAADAARVDRPNIIFILTDDLGYGDLGTFFQNQRRAGGSATPSHLTPRLDEMAAEGIRFTDHYCPAPVCAPSRASLLLGVHQGHANVRDNQFDKALENNHTIATVLKQAGYTTAAIGKWGLQGKPTTTPPDWPAHPLNRGFDYYYGYMRHKDGHEHYPKEGPIRGATEVWDNRTEVSAGLDKCYTTDLFTARAKGWIAEHRRTHSDQPFFMYLAYDTPHAATEVPTQAYPAGGGAKGGLQWLGKPEEMINTASGEIDSWYHPDYADATWDHDGEPTTAEVPWPDIYKRYATMVRRIDDGVGDLLQLLRDLEVDRNTLVVFSSDNGISQESYLEDLFRPMFFANYGPFDGIKRDLWEGGLRVPTIARWPGRVPANQVSALPSTLVDWLPTFADAAGLPAPARSDGVSLLPTMTGKGTQRTPRVYAEYFEGGTTPKFAPFEPSRQGRQRKQMQAIRFGDYMCVRYGIKSADDEFEIYDVNRDPKQKRNLASEAKFAALQQQAKETVLQIRRPDASAKRPYDKAMVPPVAVKKAEPGLRWKSYAGPLAWVPQFDTLKPVAEGTCDQLATPANATDADGLLYTGYIEVPADGEYTFSFNTDAAAVLRIHEAIVIDADFGYTPGKPVCGSILLKAGKHPFRLSQVRRGAAGQMSLDLKWAGSDVPEQPIPDSAFFRD